MDFKDFNDLNPGLAKPHAPCPLLFKQKKTPPVQRGFVCLFHHVNVQMLFHLINDSFEGYRMIHS